MAGTIKHEWDGTTLIVTSDSGTSAMDLKGEKGDMGIRGPMGAQGCIDTSLVYTTNNPPTCADVKAAPAGYGLGENGGAGKWNGDANTLTAQGWYRLEAGTTNGVGESASVRVDGYSSTDLTQTAYTRTGLIKQRTCKSGTWSEWVDCSPSAFAPAGYGYGDMPKKILDTADDVTGSLLESALENELAKMSNSTVKQIMFYAYPNIPGGYCIGTFHRHDANNAVLTSVSYNTSAGSFIKRKYNGLWNPLEWVNPPMEVGKEYLTTERWNGKPVYTKLIDFGALPNATSGYAYNVIPAEAELVSVNGYVKHSSTGSQSSIFPFVTDIWKLKNNAYIGVKTNKDMTAYNAYILLKYVK